MYSLPSITLVVIMEDISDFTDIFTLGDLSSITVLPAMFSARKVCPSFISSS